MWLFSFLTAYFSLLLVWYIFLFPSFLTIDYEFLSIAHLASVGLERAIASNRKILNNASNMIESRKRPTFSWDGSSSVSHPVKCQIGRQIPNITGVVKPRYPTSLSDVMAGCWGEGRGVSEKGERCIRIGEGVRIAGLGAPRRGGEGS